MIFCLILIELICCDPSSEPSPSDEGSQHMFLCRIDKKLSIIITKYFILSRWGGGGGGRAVR